MHGRISLNGTWGLTYAEGVGLMPPEHYTGVTLEGRKLMSATVPSSVHRVLQDHGIIEDLNIGLNSLKARWVEEQYWIYRHTFDAPKEAAQERVGAWLTMERLEFNAVVYLNGHEIGRHANAHRPARFELGDALKPGENLLVVLLETGIHEAADKPAGVYAARHIDRMTKRPLLRKPQYQNGWDWNARLLNVGILGDVELEWCDGPRLDEASVFATVNASLDEAVMHARVHLENRSETGVDSDLHMKIVETGQEASASVSLEPGETVHELRVEMANPKLWNPIHHGEQHMYTVEVSLGKGEARQTLTRRTGVRRVEVDQSPHPVEGRYFTLLINNRPVFCKGGNWVPPDLLYGDVEKERYRELVNLALEANFNLLRVWGGGEFLPREVFEACDEAGILVWHDFLFACAKYPGDDPVFADEVRREVRHAVRANAHHPSLVLWCGNNEIEWGDWHWNYDDQYKTHPHYAIFHHDIPKIVHDEDPSKFYWISSPHSPDYKHPNDPTVGDQHPWGVSILDPGGADFWTYRSYVDRFANEGGVIGMSPLATLRQFLPPDQQQLLSLSWDHHDNPFACTTKETGGLGRAYDTVRIWTGLNPEEMEWQDYAKISALLQAEGLQEYIYNYRRRMFSSAAAVFWMYNDSWPVTHGWTIIDYYRRKKISFHPVRRAFAPLSVALAVEGDEVVIFGLNDLLEAWTGQLRYGVFLLKGELAEDREENVTLAPNTSTPIARIPLASWKKHGTAASGTFAVLQRDGQTVAQNRLLLERFKDLEWGESGIQVEQKQDHVEFTSNVFQWGVCLDVEGDRTPADNCFDLLPGISYSVAWPDKSETPKVVYRGQESLR